jgi:hypothetical protein
VPVSRPSDSDPLPSPQATVPHSPPQEWSVRGLLRTVGIVALALALPLAWHPAMAVLSTGQVVPSYLPALESARERGPFRGQPIEDLKYLQPAHVFIGDSMLGTRINPATFGGLTGEHVAFLARAGTGSAYWYLAI